MRVYIATQLLSMTNCKTRGQEAREGSNEITVIVTYDSNSM